jgi:hypothetical protein
MPREIERNADYRLLQRFGERVVRYWSFNVGERKDNPCGRAVARALLDYEVWDRQNRGPHRCWGKEALEE